MRESSGKSDKFIALQHIDEAKLTQRGRL